MVAIGFGATSCLRFPQSLPAALRFLFEPPRLLEFQQLFEEQLLAPEHVLEHHAAFFTLFLFVRRIAHSLSFRWGDAGYLLSAYASLIGFVQDNRASVDLRLLHR